MQIKEIVKKNIAYLVIFALVVGFFTYGQSREDEKIGLDSLLAEYADAAAVDYFLKIEGIDGESADKGHKDWIDIQSWSWGASNPVSTGGGGGGGAGKVQMQDFHFTTMVSKATPKLMEHLATGKHISKVEFTARKDKSEDYLKWTFEDVLISSYSVGGSSGGIPTESVSFNFTKIEVEYVPERGDPVRFTWDLQENRE